MRTSAIDPLCRKILEELQFPINTLNLDDAIFIKEQLHMTVNQIGFIINDREPIRLSQQ